MGFVDRGIRRRYHLTIGGLIDLISNDPHSVAAVDTSLKASYIRTDTHCVIIGAQSYKDDCCLLGVKSSNSYEPSKKVLRNGESVLNFLKDYLIGDLYYSERAPLWFRRGRKSEDKSRPIIGYSYSAGELILRTIDINDSIHRI